MPQLQGLAAQLLPYFKENHHAVWAECLQVDSSSAATLLRYLNSILLGQPDSNVVKSINNVIETDFLWRLSANAQKFIKEIQQLIAPLNIQKQELSKRQVVAISLLLDPNFIKMSQYFLSQYERNYKYFLDTLYTVAERNDPWSEEDLLNQLDDVVYYSSLLLRRKLIENPSSKELKQHIDYFKFMTAKLYQPGWLSSTMALMLGFLSNLIANLIFANPIHAILRSIYIQNTYPLFEALKYPVNIFAAPTRGAQFGWRNGLRGLFSFLKLQWPNLLNRYEFMSFAVIGLVITSALLIAFFPPAIPFVLGLPALGFLASLSMPLLASVVGLTVGVVLLGIASLATVAMRPSKNQSSYALQEGATAKQSAADANDAVAPAVSPVAALAAVPSAGKTTLATDAADSASTSKPLFSKAQGIPLQEGAVKIKLSRLCIYGDSNKEQVLSKGETSEELSGLTVTYNQDNTFTININNVTALPTHIVEIGDQKIVFDSGQPREALPVGFTYHATFDEQPVAAPQASK